MSSDLCYKDIKLIPQWLFAANDACFSAPKMDQRIIFDFWESAIFHVAHHPAAMNVASESLTFEPYIDHEL